MLHGGKNFREFDRRVSLTEAAIEMFLDKSCTLYDTKIIPLNIVLLRSPEAQNAQAVDQIKSTHVYDKWKQ